MLATVENDAKADPQIPDELAGELMSIAEDLSGLSATFQVVKNALRDSETGAKLIMKCAEGRALEFLSMALSRVSDELDDFIRMNSEGGAKSTETREPARRNAATSRRA